MNLYSCLLTYSFRILALVILCNCPLLSAQETVIEGSPIPLADGKLLIVGEVDGKVVVLKVFDPLKKKKDIPSFADGDIIVSMSGKSINDLKEFNTVYLGIAEGSEIEFMVERNTKKLKLKIRKQKPGITVPKGAIPGRGNWRSEETNANNKIAAKSQDAFKLQIDALIKQTAGTDGPGLVVGVSHRGQTIYLNAVGMGSLEHSIKLSNDSVLPIASVSKQFAGYAIALLNVQGKLDIDDTIDQWLPEIKLGQQVTLRDLLYHTSGLKDYTGLMSLTGWKYGDQITSDNILSLMSKQTQLDFTPGSQHRYSNTNYALLPIIIERVSGRSFADFLQQEIFALLEMNSTVIPAVSKQPLKKLADSYYRTTDGTLAQLHGYGSATGAGGIYSTNGDMLRWGAEISDPQILDKQAVQLMLTPGKLSNGEQLQYGFGIGVSTSHGQTRFAHSGSTRGSSSVLHIFLDQELVIALMSNFGDAEVYRAADTIASLFLADKKATGHEENENNGRPRGAMMLTDDDFDGKGFAKGVEIDPRILVGLAGRYRLEDDRELIIVGDGNAIKLKLRDDIPGIPLVHLGKGRFRFTPGKWDISFDLSESPATKLTVHLMEDSIRRGPAGDIKGNRQDENVLEPADLLPYCGTYFSNELNTAYDIVFRENELFLSHPQLGRLRLQHHSGDTFGVPGKQISRIIFERDPSNKASVVSFIAEAYAWGATSEFTRLKNSKVNPEK